MDLLGPSLEELLWTECAGTTLPAGCVLEVARQALERLQRLHHHGYVHNDVTPSNLCIGTAHRNDVIHLVDFGVASPAGLASWDASNHGVGGARASSSGSSSGGSSSGGSSSSGTSSGGTSSGGTSSGGTTSGGGAVPSPVFASLAALERQPTGPQDDLESLVYALVYLAAGGLPWHATNSLDDIRSAKARIRRQPGSARELFSSVTADLAAALSALWSQVCALDAEDAMCCGAPSDKPNSHDYDAEWPAACRTALRESCALDDAGADGEWPFQPSCIVRYTRDM